MSWKKWKSCKTLKSCWPLFKKKKLSSNQFLLDSENEEITPLVLLDETLNIEEDNTVTIAFDDVVRSDSGNKHLLADYGNPRKNKKKILQLSNFGYTSSGAWRNDDFGPDPNFDPPKKITLCDKVGNCFRGTLKNFGLIKEKGKGINRKKSLKYKVYKLKKNIASNHRKTKNHKKHSRRLKHTQKKH